MQLKKKKTPPERTQLLRQVVNGRVVAWRVWTTVRRPYLVFLSSCVPSHYFRISALEATLRVSNPLISVPPPLSPSLCMQPHFLLGWNASNRSFFARQLSRWYGSSLESFVYTASRPRFVSNPSCAAEARRYRRNENVAWKRSAGIGRMISINPHSSVVFLNLFWHYVYLSG